jgi:hypothetical protein
MDKKKLAYNAEVMELPPLRLVIGDIPSPDPDRRLKPNQHTRKPMRDMEGTVNRIIAHLKESK